MGALLLKRATEWMQKLKPSHDRHVCLYVSGSVVASVVTRLDEGVRTEVRASPMASLTDMERLLGEQNAVLGLSSAAPCNLVLAPELYNVHLIDRPEVSDEELRDAVRWKIQEQVDYQVDTACIDVFDLPHGASRQGNMVYVVSLPKDLLAKMIHSVTSVGIKVDSVDISELALRNLAWQCFPMVDQSVAILRLTSNSGMINISRGDQLYLARRLSGVPTKLNDSEWLEFRERMLLQVQRSLDYYQGAMAQAPCNMLMVACTHSWTPLVTEYLTEMLPMPVRTVTETLAPEFQIDLHNPEPSEVDWEAVTDAETNALVAALPALGGALRNRLQEISGATA